MTTGPSLPANPFYASPEQRVALARQHFFENGVRPSGMVSEAVIQSWSRCLRTHPDPTRPAVFEPVTTSRVHGALRRNRERLEAAGVRVRRLEPLPHVVLAGERIAVSHMNFYLCNDAVIVPLAGVETDDQALATIADAYPGREVVGVPGAVLAYGGGGPHCITQQVPAR
jgi:hypothetical protein